MLAAVALSDDHKPARNDEHDRIEDAGGAVIWAGTWRVSGVLAVSRAFGDRPLKRYVISRPDVRHVDVGTGEEMLVLASDGIWDVMTNQVRSRSLCLHEPPAHGDRQRTKGVTSDAEHVISLVVLPSAEVHNAPSLCAGGSQLGTQVQR